MKQGERRLFVLNSNSLQPMYSNLGNNSIVFYDVHVLRVRNWLLHILDLKLTSEISLFLDKEEHERTGTIRTDPSWSNAQSWQSRLAFKSTKHQREEQILGWTNERCNL